MNTGFALLCAFLLHCVLCDTCNCPEVDVLKDIVQSEMMERKILSTKLERLQAFVKTENTGGAAAHVLEEKLMMMDNLMQQSRDELKTLKDIRQRTERLHIALVNAWKIQKRDLVNLNTEVKKDMVIAAENVRDLKISVNGKIEAASKTISLHVDDTKNQLKTQVRNFNDKFNTVLSQQKGNLDEIKQNLFAQIGTLEVSLQDYRATCSDGLQELKTAVADVEKNARDQLHSVWNNYENQVNTTLREFSKHIDRALSEVMKKPNPPVYKCYGWTQEDLNYLHSSYSIVKEKIRCEVYPNQVFTHGYNVLYPGCGTCWCCKRVDGQSRTIIPRGGILP